MRLALTYCALAAACAWGALQVRHMTLLDVASAPSDAGQRDRPAPPPSRGLTATPVGAVQISDDEAADQPPEPALNVFRALNAPAPQTPPAPQAGERFALVGVVARDGALTAYLKDEVDGRVWTASREQAVAQWRVADLDNRCVQLVRRRQMQSVCLS